MEHIDVKLFKTLIESDLYANELSQYDCFAKLCGKMVHGDDLTLSGETVYRVWKNHITPSMKYICERRILLVEEIQKPFNSLLHAFMVNRLSYMIDHPDGFYYSLIIHCDGIEFSFNIGVAREEPYLVGYFIRPITWDTEEYPL